MQDAVGSPGMSFPHVTPLLEEGAEGLTRAAHPKEELLTGGQRLGHGHGVLQPSDGDGACCEVALTLHAQEWDRGGG